MSDRTWGRLDVGTSEVGRAVSGGIENQIFCDAFPRPVRDSDADSRRRPGIDAEDRRNHSADLLDPAFDITLSRCLPLSLYEDGNSDRDALSIFDVARFRRMPSAHHSTPAHDEITRTRSRKDRSL